MERVLEESRARNETEKAAHPPELPIRYALVLHQLSMRPARARYVHLKTVLRNRTPVRLVLLVAQLS
jgi:hypothetical protein